MRITQGQSAHIDIDEIQLAVFAHNGKFSILPKATNRPATPKNLKITAKATHIGVDALSETIFLARARMKNG